MNADGTALALAIKIRDTGPTPMIGSIKRQNARHLMVNVTSKVHGISRRFAACIFDIGHRTPGLRSTVRASCGNCPCSWQKTSFQRVLSQ